MTDKKDPNRKLRLALMGEFSAGKSTLANLLLEQETSPVQVTATQMPPVWYSYGAPAAACHTPSGDITELDAETWRDTPIAGATQVSVSLEAPFLTACDLIDMPGTSDPNLAFELWEKVLPEVDCAIWCTPANQAWRQSEAALWEHVNPKLWKNSLLLVTRVDKLLNERDKARITMRVRRETQGLFQDVLPISLTQSLAADHNRDALEAAGASALMDRISAIFESLDRHPLPARKTRSSAPQREVDAVADTPKITPRRVIRRGPIRARPPAEARLH